MSALYAIYALLGLVVYMTYTVAMFGVAMMHPRSGDLANKSWYFRWTFNTGIFLAIPGFVLLGAFAWVMDKLSGWHT